MHPVLIFTILFAISFISIPLVWKNKKYPHVEYVLTNNRLILKPGTNNNNLWIMRLDEISEILIKIERLDRLFDTGKLYPISSKYPIEPDYHPHRELNYPVGRVYNFSKQKYDGELTIMVRNHPKLESIKEPEKFIKILEKAINDYKNQSSNFALS